MQTELSAELGALDSSCRLGPQIDHRSGGIVSQDTRAGCGGRNGGGVIWKRSTVFLTFGRIYQCQYDNL